MKKSKTLVALLLLTIIGVTGLTIAYFSNSQSIENSFKTKSYGTIIEEEFASPDNWLPGDTTEKTVVATNTGQVDEAVRISLSESWTTANNGTLNGWITAEGNKSSHLEENEPSADERVAIINFTNERDWTKVGDYYYYNYKLAPGESTSSFIESVTFNPKTKLDDTCVTTTDGDTGTITCNSSGDDYDNAKYKLAINIETVQYDKYAIAWNTGSTVEIEKSKPVQAVQYLLNNAVNNSDAEYDETTKSNMFVFNQDATEQTGSLTDYRYIGDAPNNYVYFNCDNNGINCETWRIIGVFDVERINPEDSTQKITEQRVKLVRGSDFSNTMNWDSNLQNDWSTSTLNIFLNGKYYNREGSAATYGLKPLAKEMINEAIYYLGANNTSAGTAKEAYAWERGNVPCGNCNGDTEKLSWQGNVGLMYISDQYIVYDKGVNDYCYNNLSDCLGTNATTGWVFKSNTRIGNPDIQGTWFISSYSNSLDNVFVMSSVGYVYGNQTNNTRGVRPVIYLSSDVKIAGGNGTQQKPYKLTI